MSAGRVAGDAGAGVETERVGAGLMLGRGAALPGAVAGLVLRSERKEGVFRAGSEGLPCWVGELPGLAVGRLGAFGTLGTGFMPALPLGREEGSPALPMEREGTPASGRTGAVAAGEDRPGAVAPNTGGTGLAEAPPGRDGTIPLEAEGEGLFLRDSWRARIDWGGAELAPGSAWTRGRKAAISGRTAEEAALTRWAARSGVEASATAYFRTS